MADEEWVDVDPKDIVLDVPGDGRITIVARQGETMYGALVRKRDGKWMKRVRPLEIEHAGLLREKHARREYVLGSDLR